jgi:uncharacterized Zn-binding protein involved in type VI secretion
MGLPAARLGDMHACPMITVLVPHVGGPIAPPCAPMVLIGGQPAARVGDLCVCVGPPDVIAMGSLGVMIMSQPAARMGDITAHGGTIVAGMPNVLIGDIGMGTPATPGMGMVDNGVSAPAPPGKADVASFEGSEPWKMAGGSSGAPAPASPAQKCLDMANALKGKVNDPDDVLSEIANRANDPAQADEAVKLMEKIDAEVNPKNSDGSPAPPKFSEPPTLQILKEPEVTQRASDSFDREVTNPDGTKSYKDDAEILDGKRPEIIDPATGKPEGPRKAPEQGTYSSDTGSREENAVLEGWNKMDVNEQQEIPAGAVVLRGPAAPMTEPAPAGASASDEPPKTYSGGAQQIATLGSCPPDGPISSKIPERKVIGPVAKTGPMGGPTSSGEWN